MDELGWDYDWGLRWP